MYVFLDASSSPVEALALDSIQSLLLKFHPSDSNHFYVGTDMVSIQLSLNPSVMADGPYVVRKASSGESGMLLDMIVVIISVMSEDC